MSEILIDDKTENAIDIFVFSNGEQNSPPRKYHLELNEFAMWKETLRYLGHSQYGLEIYTSCQSSIPDEGYKNKPFFSDADIDIYTTDGKKLEGPSQLRHLTAYVAVKPPSDFINAGYDNYLIKATRSWEKRLLKITNSMESSTKDPIKSILPKSELNIMFTEQHLYNQNKKEDSRGNVNIKTKSIVLKSESAKIKKAQEHNKVVKWPTDGKQIKKPETTTLRKQVMAPLKLSSATKRPVIKTKESLPKKPLAVKKMFHTHVKKNDILKACNNFESGQLSEKVVSPTAITSLKILENESHTKSASKNDISSNLKKPQDEDTINLSVNEEKFSSNYNEITENETSENAEEKHDESLNAIFNENLKNDVQSILDKDYINTFEVSVRRDGSKMSIPKSENKEVTHYIKPNITLEKQLAINSKPSLINYRNCSPMQKPLNNFVTIVNDDKIFRIQLNLEIENCNFALKNENKDLRTTQSVKNNLREEKETQVNMYEKSDQSNDQICHQYQYPFLTNDVVKNVVNDEEKIIIIHCSCCNNIDPNYHLLSNIGSNQNSPRGLAPEINFGIVEGVIRCECEQSVPNIESQENLPATDLVNTFNRKNSFNSEKSANILLKTSKTELVKSSGTVGNGTGEFTTYQIPGDKSLHTFLNRDTQTSWCNVVLQAVRSEDGRYSFHLPPLNTVKNMTSHGTR